MAKQKEGSATLVAGSKPSAPISLATDWVEVVASAETADNTGNTVQNTSGFAADRWLDVANVGTSIQVRCKYPAGATITTSPVIQIIGRDRNHVPQRLYDDSDPPEHEIELTCDPTTDLSDGTSQYSEVVQVDCHANSEVAVAIKTAANTTGTPSILARIQ